ncbi:hypothetical protein EGW08_010548 [Elysia chlorotica]|uniref:Uncharacterized protein n=1 Tax=Elysia chlorotica TaxID=188477 RepID=A0A433TJH8_ELYCH|nr:hypothetical protein EGW08_010548 [Elysia chlorotica]
MIEWKQTFIKSALKQHRIELNRPSTLRGFNIVLLFCVLLQTVAGDAKGTCVLRISPAPLRLPVWALAMGLARQAGVCLAMFGTSALTLRHSCIWVDLPALQ